MDGRDILDRLSRTCYLARLTVRLGSGGGRWDRAYLRCLAEQGRRRLAAHTLLTPIGRLLPTGALPAWRAEEGSLGDAFLRAAREAGMSAHWQVAILPVSPWPQGLDPATPEGQALERTAQATWLALRSAYRAHIHRLATLALASLERNCGFLPGRNAKALSSLRDWAERMDVTDDRLVRRAVEGVLVLLSARGASPNGELWDALQALADITFQYPLADRGG
jgi:hypothetical protein